MSNVPDVSYTMAYIPNDVGVHSLSFLVLCTKIVELRILPLHVSHGIILEWRSK